MNEGKNIMKNQQRTHSGLDQDFDYLTSACSVTECTGLIPANPDTMDHETDPYQEVFPYQPPKIPVNAK